MGVYYFRSYYDFTDFFRKFKLRFSNEEKEVLFLTFLINISVLLLVFDNFQFLHFLEVLGKSTNPRWPPWPSYDVIVFRCGHQGKYLKTIYHASLIVTALYLLSYGGTWGEGVAESPRPEK